MTESFNNLQADLFTVPDAWSGGHYEIAVEIGARSDDRAAVVLGRLWSYGALQGCYLFKDREIKGQTLVNPPEHLEDNLYGIATLPNGASIGFRG